MEIQTQQANQLYNQYSHQQFKDILKQLSHKMQFRHLQNIDNLYNQIVIDKGKVTGRDIADLLQKIVQQQKIQKQIHQQLLMYQQIIDKLILVDKCISITKKQFNEYFNKSPNKIGIIGQQINNRISDVENISLKKLRKLLNNIQNNVLIVDNMVKLPSDAVQLQKTQYFHQQSLIDQQSNIQQQIHRIQKLIADIPDTYFCDNIQQINNRIIVSYKALKYRVQQSQKNQQKLHQRIQQLQATMFELQKQYQQKQAYYNKKQTRTQQSLQQKCSQNKQLIDDIHNLVQQNNILVKQKYQLYNKNQQIQSQLVWYKDNNKSLKQAYQQYLQKQAQKLRETQKQHQNQLFSQRSNKEELQDARYTIQKLRAQNQSLYKQLSSQQANYMLQINQLQLKMRENQQILLNLKRNNQFSQVRSSMYQRSMYQRSSILQSDYHRNVYPSVSLVVQQVQKNLQSAFKKRKQIISEQISVCFTAQIHYDQSKTDQLGIQNTQELKKVINQCYEPSQLKNTKNQDKPFLSCSAFIINNSDRYFPIGLLILEDRIVVLDTKNRYNFAFLIKQIKTIYFCYYNTSWMVIHFKQKQLNDKGINLADMVISLRNRDEVGQFIRDNCFNHSSQRILYEKQQNIWVNTAQNKEIMLSKYPQYYNLFRMTVNNANQIFEADIKEKGLLNFTYQVFLVPCEIGLLAFEKDSSELIQKSQKMATLIPIVQKMQIQVNKQKIQLILKYNYSKKVIKIKMRSISLIAKLQQVIQNHKSGIKHKKLKMMKNFGLNNSRLTFSK